MMNTRQRINSLDKGNVFYILTLLVLPVDTEPGIS